MKMPSIIHKCYYKKNALSKQLAIYYLHSQCWLLQLNDITIRYNNYLAKKNRLFTINPYRKIKCKDVAADGNRVFL